MNRAHDAHSQWVDDFTNTDIAFSSIPDTLRPTTSQRHHPGTHWPTPMTDIEADFLQLARVSLSGRTQDVQLVLRRVTKRCNRDRPDLAQALTTLLRQSPTPASPLRQADVPLPVDAETREHLMQVETHPVLDHEPVFAPDVASPIGQLVAERQHPEKLLRAGLEPTRSALFVGPPGVGKTMTAYWLARELQKPLLVLDLAAVMSSYLGRTGNNLRHVLQYAKGLDCVLLLDELDAIAKHRDDRGEIGELKRLVTVLIQQIDDWPSSSLLLSATNHPALLDSAIWRRFELHIAFPLPDADCIALFVETMLAPHFPAAKEWARVLATAFEGRSFSDIERDLTAARRTAVLENKPLNDQFTAFVSDRTLPKSIRIKLAAAAVEQGLFSQRKAHQLTGVARDTIRNRSTTGAKRSHTA